MLLVATSCFKGYGLHKSFELIATSGYDGVDLVLSGSEYDTENAEYIEHLEALTGVQVYALTAYERRMDASVLAGIIALESDSE